MKHFLTLMLVLQATFAVTAQSSNRVSGVVNEKAGKPISGASIELYYYGDTATAAVTYSKPDGSFELPLSKTGMYRLRASMVGFENHLIDSIRVEGLVSIPHIQLKPAIQVMKEVVVTGKKPVFEQKTDRMVVNVDASPTNAGATALEVLEKSPGVTVDQDGNISLKGKAGVMVFVDGKPTYLSGAELVNFLRNLSGAQLEQIEIMTNPPARYDAAGNSGIINIKTKKQKQQGYNLSLTGAFAQGVYARNNQAAVFNYRKNKLNVFGNLSRNERNHFQELRIQRRFMEPVSKQVVSHFEQVSMMRQYNNSNNMKLGADFQVTPKTSVGTVVNGFYNASTFANNSDINIADAQGNLQYITRAQSRSQDLFRHLGGNVNMRHRFDSTGRELTADLDYLYYNSRNRMHMINRYTNAAGVPILTPDTIAGNLPQLIHIYSAKADYVHPLQKGARFEAGWKSSYVATDNNAVYDSILNGNPVRDIGRSNYFIYQEQIHAAYANYTRTFSKKLNAQLGLRMEHTAANGMQRTTGERFELNYTQLFPTAYLQYQPGEHNSFVLNYGRRIRRPDYRSLNPFVEFLDRFTFEQGNPYLRPQFSHNIELSHSFKRFLTTTLNYTQTNNIIQQVMEQDEQTNQTFVKQANIARQQQVGIAVNAMAQVKQFSGNLYVNAFYNEFEGLVNNTPIHFGAFTTVLNGSASYRFKKGQQVELSGFYRTPAIEGVMRIGAFGMLNIGASTPLFKNKGTLRLNVRDVLWSQRVKGEARFGNIDAAFQQFNDSRVATISFTYRINKGTVNGNGSRRKTGATEEQERVQPSN